MSNLDVGDMVTGAVFVALGTLFLLAQLDVIQLRADLLLPGTMVAAGGAIILGALFRRR